MTRARCAGQIDDGKQEDIKMRKRTEEKKDGIWNDGGVNGVENNGWCNYENSENPKTELIAASERR